MIDERGVLFGVIAVVGVTAIVSGPLVGAVDLTSADRVESSVGVSGSVDVGDVDFPGDFELEAGRFGADTYYLRVPDATVELRRVIDQVVVTYRLSIADLGFTRESVFFVTERNEGTFALTMGETTIDPADVANDTYEGELSVNVRSDTVSRTVANETITIEVDE